jgi:hypothetical protein
MPTTPTDEMDDSDRWTDWPCCPECGQRRQTFCPTCDLAGDDFLLAEYIPASEPLAIPAGQSEETRSRDSEAGCCGGAACGPPTDQSGNDASEAVTPRGSCDAPPAGCRTDPHDSGPVLLFCPDCSEAFTPRFFRLCARCGYDFGEGRTVAGPPHSEVNNRVLLTVIVLLGLAVAAMVYFWYLFR